MKTLQNNSLQRIERARKTQAYKQMLDQQIRMKRQMQRQSVHRKIFQKRHSTEPSYNTFDTRDLSSCDTIEKHSSSFLPIIYNNSAKHQTKLLSIKKSKPYQSMQYQSSEDETYRYLRDCEQIIQNLRMLTRKNIQNSRKHDRSFSLHFKKQKQTIDHFQRGMLSKQLQSHYQSDKSKRHDPQILRISLPQGSRSNSLHNSQQIGQKHRKSKQPVLYDDDKTQRPKNRYQKPSQNSQRQVYNQFEDDLLNKQGNKLVGSGYKTKTISDQHESKISSARRSNAQSGLSSKNLGNSTVNKNRLFSDENSKSGRYRIQQMNQSPLKGTNIKQQEQQNTAKRNQQQLEKSRISQKNTIVLKHLMKARQRGTLLFKKIKQYKQQRQTLIKQIQKKQISQQ